MQHPAQRFQTRLSQTNNLTRLPLKPNLGNAAECMRDFYVIVVVIVSTAEENASFGMEGFDSGVNQVQFVLGEICFVEIVDYSVFGPEIVGFGIGRVVVGGGGGCGGWAGEAVV